MLPSPVRHTPLHLRTCRRECKTFDGNHKFGGNMKINKKHILVVKKIKLSLFIVYNMYSRTKVKIQTRIGEIHTKITNFRFMRTKR